MHQMFRKLAIRGIVSSISPHLQSSRNGTSKHYNPKFKKERAAKVIKIELPDFDEIRNEKKLSLEEIRSKMKEKGIVPGRDWEEKPLCISCSGGVMDPYVPPEGDGKMSLLSTSGVKQQTELITQKGKSYKALRKIRRFEYDFDVPTLANKAQEIYIEAHSALQNYSENEDRLHDLVTEKCYPEMIENIEYKTIRWKFIQSLEIPRVVQVRYEEMMSKENVFAQATIRFHTQQILAVYDRFGRLMHGSEDVVKDVLEYIVFEKSLTDLYGAWRIHSKIIPDWIPKRDSILKTFILKHEVPVMENVPNTAGVESDIASVEGDKAGPQPAVA